MRRSGVFILAACVLAVSSWLFTGALNLDGRPSDRELSDVTPLKVLPDTSTEVERRLRVGAGSAGETLEIRVLSDTGEEVPRARILVLSITGGIVDEAVALNGRVELLREEPVDYFIQCVADSYATSDLLLWPSSSVLEIRLVPRASITGDLLDYWSVRAGPGVWVAAWERSHRSGPSGIQQAIANDENAWCHLTRTNENGEFSFSGLSSEKEYLVQAFGEGVISSIKRLGGLDESATISLVGGRLRIAPIQLLDSESGRPPLANSRLGGRGVGIHEAPESTPACRPINLSVESLRRAGVSDSMIEHESEVHQYLLTTVVGFSELGPALGTVKATIPGYSSASLKLEYQAVAASVPVVTVQLDRQVQEWGKLEVQIQAGAENEPGAAEAPGIAFSLRLVPTSPSADLPSWLDIAVEPGRDGLVHIDGVPCGEYTASLRTMSGVLSISPQGSSSIRVVADRGVERAVFDLESWHRQEFNLSDAALNPYLGPFEGVFLVETAIGHRELPFYFPGPPYTFVALPPGEYSLMTDPPVMFPPPANPREAGAAFTVGPETAGIVHDLEVVF